MTREPIYIDPYQKRIAQLQGMEMPQLGQHAVMPYLQNRGSEPMASNAQYADVIGDHNAYLANQQRMAAEQAYNAQQQAAGLATNANFEALKQEKAENMVKISKLKAELAQLQTTLGDEDSFSRELAANRARIGDLANSRAHQQDIANRFQWRWQAEQNEKSREADKELQRRKEIQTLIGNIEDLDVMLAGPQIDSKTRDALKVKRNRLERELKAYGRDYIGVQTGASVQSVGGAKTISQLNEEYSNMLARGLQKKYPSKADMARFKAELDKLQDSPEKAELVNKYNALKSAEDYKAGVARAEKAIKDAVAEAKKHYPTGYLPNNGEYKFGNTTVKVEFKDGKNRYYVNGKEY